MLVWLLALWLVRARGSQPSIEVVQCVDDANHSPWVDSANSFENSIAEYCSIE
jgi:hypothetical protein